ncbi:hypothetical protein CRG98_015775 [Punica granatum]|uniref:Transmembrane protein n=1 Tax=Punica granatum TaxID=22663 RepID=A0A2I0K5J4_PUNGR|nr:hypothetical protein CRG98_015775 [Punica granatum]
MACFRRINVLLIVLVIFVVVLSSGGVEAARALPEEFARANHLSSAYERAKYTMSFWFERLASGPSPRGPGH